MTAATPEDMTAEEYQAWLAQQKTSKSKYGNRKTEVDGIRFDSVAEAKRYGELQLLVAAGEINELVLQPRFPLMVNGEKVGTYSADFQYRDRDGRLLVEDVKGMPTTVYRLKKRLMKAVHGIEIREV